MNRYEVDREKLSPMMRQYMEIKDKYSDSILFFRLGDFYEMFFEDAYIASKELEIALTGKSSGLDERVPMCGIPFHAYQSYLEKLVNNGHKVAICEQLTLPNKNKMVERGVIQVVTKGTIMEQNSLDEKNNNYIGSIYDFEYCFVVSYADITTGEIYSIVINHEIDKLISEIIKLDIKEVIVNDKIDRYILNVLRENYNILASISEQLLDDGLYQNVYQRERDIRIITSIKHLLFYLNDTKKNTLLHLQPVIVINKKEYLELDFYTKKNLELTENIRLRDKSYSLLWLLDKTKTAMGSRLLRHYIENPLMDIDKINYRYDMINKLLVEFILKEELLEQLNNIYDLERLAGRISYGNLNARDLLQLKASLKVLPDIKKILDQLKYDKELYVLDDLYNILNLAINEDPPLTIKEGQIIKKGYNKELDELRGLSSGGKDFILKLEQEEKEKTGIKNLRVGYNRIFGYYIEVSKGSIKEIKEEFGYQRKQTLSNCERFSTPLLKEKEELIVSAEDKIIALEYDIFIKIRDIVRTYIPKLQEISKVLAEIDVLLSFAIVSEKNNYIRPTLVTERNIYIKNARHPVIEKVNKCDYVPNDIIMNEKTSILLITGPNMAGKSTYMRQLAIIIIMAQIGCYVPCNEATIPIFDKIFTRIGASDDLVSGESTFMVEMKEANNAIKNATSNSLILFDELGRGTATYDGMALAQAILEYIHNNVKAKTLFSTHYHELTVLERELKYLKNVHVSAIEENGTITFLHKIKMGAIDKSYGLNVAALANIPKEIIDRSEEILSLYENKVPKEKKNITMQTSLFLEEDPKENEIEKKLKNINILEITPIEALNILYDLKKNIK